MLADAKVTHLITREAFVGLCGLEIPTRILLDTDCEEIAAQAFCGPNSLQWSGKRRLLHLYSARPAAKWSAGEHRQVVRLIKNDKFYFDFDGNDVLDPVSLLLL